MVKQVLTHLLQDVISGPVKEADVDHHPSVDLGQRQKLIRTFKQVSRIKITFSFLCFVVVYRMCSFVESLPIF